MASPEIETGNLETLTISTVVSQPEEKSVSVSTCTYCSISGVELKACGRCLKVSYCCPEHQKSDWKKHKNDCLAFRETTNEFGKCLIAVRAIKCGELIFSEVELIKSPYSNAATNAEQLWSICLGCCKVLNENADINDEQLCEKCHWPLCNPACVGIGDHTEFECRTFQEAGIRASTAKEILIDFDKDLSSDLIYTCIKVLRILHLQDTDPIKWKNILGLNSREERKNDLAQAHISNFIVKFINEHCHLMNYSPSLIDKVLGIVLVNICGTIVTFQGTTRLVGRIYEFGSKLAHSCVPNVQFVEQEDGPSQIKAIRAIRPKELLYDSYEFYKLFFENNVNRRLYMHSHYFFWCSCPRCSDPTELGTYASAIKCKNRHVQKSKRCKGYLLPMNSLNVKSDWVCNMCGDVKEYDLLNQNIILRIQSDFVKAKTIQEHLDLLHRNANITVHENHSLMMVIRIKIINQVSRCITGGSRDRSPGFSQAHQEFFGLVAKCMDLLDSLGLGSVCIRALLLYYKATVLDYNNDNTAISMAAHMKTLAEQAEVEEEAIRVFENSGIYELGEYSYNAYKWLIDRTTAQTYKILLEHLS